MESVDEEEAESVSEKVCEAGRRQGMRQSDWDVQKQYFREDRGSPVSVLWRDQVRATHTSGNSFQVVGAAASHRGKRVGRQWNSCLLGERRNGQETGFTIPGRYEES